MGNLLTALSVQLAALTAMAGVGGGLHLPTLHLYQNNVTPDKGTILADLMEATFGGYAAIAGLAWSASFLDPILETANMVIPTQVFIATDSVTPNIVYGWYLTDAAGTGYMGGGRLPAPVPMNANHDACLVDVRFMYGM